MQSILFMHKFAKYYYQVLWISFIFTIYLEKNLLYNNNGNLAHCRERSYARHKWFSMFRDNQMGCEIKLLYLDYSEATVVNQLTGCFPSHESTSINAYIPNFGNIHWENYTSNTFHIEWDIIMVTDFLSILNQMEFHLVQNRKEYCHHDHIPLNVKGNGNIVFSVWERVISYREFICLCSEVWGIDL